MPHILFTTTYLLVVAPFVLDQFKESCGLADLWHKETKRLFGYRGIARPQKVLY